jgi:hypothetical protein
LFEQIRLYVEKYTAPPGEGGVPEPEDGAEARLPPTLHIKH